MAKTGEHTGSWKKIKRWKAQGKSQAWIARKLLISPQAVSYAIKQMAKGGA